MNPGFLGLTANWKTGVILRTIPNTQAALHKIEPGWKIVKINREPYEFKLLRRLLTGSRPYKLTVLTTPGEN